MTEVIEKDPLSYTLTASCERAYKTLAADNQMVAAAIIRSYPEFMRSMQNLIDSQREALEAYRLMFKKSLE